MSTGEESREPCWSGLRAEARLALQTRYKEIVRKVYFKRPERGEIHGYYGPPTDEELALYETLALMQMRPDVPFTPNDIEAMLLIRSMPKDGEEPGLAEIRRLRSCYEKALDYIVNA